MGFATRARMLLFVLFIASPAIAAGTQVQALFDLSNVNGAPFPSNRYSQLDLKQITGLRVDLPKPDCAIRPSDCQDVDVINTLDGFNLQPRLAIPFSGPIDVASVNSSNVFLVSIDDRNRLFGGFGDVVGINQIVWDSATNTLYAESDELLRQHTTYALIVTNDVRDANGQRISGRGFAEFARDWKSIRGDLRLSIYRASLLTSLAAIRMPVHKIAVASLFTTQSATAVLEKVRHQIKQQKPMPADFDLGSDGSRAVFPLNAVTNIVFNRQVGTAPNFQTSALPLAALNVLPNSVSTIAYGRYRSPSYLTNERYIPPFATRLSMPKPTGSEDIYFQLLIPSTPKPANGYPVAIFGHGFGGDKHSSALTVAASMAMQGIATMSINVVGHGGGDQGTLVVNGPSGAVTLNAGGRGIDQDGNGTIEGTEGVNAAATRNIISNRDGLRQTVIDLMQLTRVIETGGIDIDGDGNYDLDPKRIYYFGQSFGGIYGTMLLAVEPSIDAGVPNVPGGSNIEIARLGAFRPLVAQGLAARTPALLNSPPFAPPLYGFNENMPLRNEAPRINDVPGAIALQDYFDRSEWVSQSGNPVAYAPHIRKAPLFGMKPKPVIVQIAKGDTVVPNPTNTALIRAGDLKDRTTYFRNDLADAANPATPNNPHGFLTAIGSPVTAFIALAAQSQIATFFASDGAITVDPDGEGPLFETPIVQLPEELNYIQ